MRRRAVVIAAIVVLGTTGCSRGTTGSPTTAADGPRSTVTQTVTAAPPTGAAATTTARTTTAGTAPAGLTAGLTPLSGKQGVVVYDVQVPTINGSSAAAERFNSSMRTSLNQTLTQLDSFAAQFGSATLKVGQLADRQQSRVTRISSGVLAGVLLTSSFVKGGAHPYAVIGTVVINAKTARPVLLTDLFSSPDAGLSRVAELARVRATTDLTRGASIDDPKRDLANWVPDENGLTLYASVTSAQGGYAPITIPWAELRGVISPAMWPVVTE